MKKKFIMAVATLVLALFGLGSCQYLTHDHSYGSSWEKDATHHWQVCQVDGCDRISGKAVHTGGTATETEKAKCEVCGVSYGSLKGEEEHTHAFTVSKVDANYLVSAADCDSKAVYYKSCECGEKGSETFEYGDVLGHDYTNASWAYDGTQHWQVCTRDNCNVTSTKANHTGGTATETAKAVCEVCHQPYGEFASHTHTYGEWTTKTPASCLEAEVEHRICSNPNCGHEETRDGDPALDHDNHIQFDGTQHWYECTRDNCDYETNKENHRGGEATETEKAVCEVCNQPYGELVGHTHTYGEWITKTPADCEHAEVEHRVCSNPTFSS